MLSAGSLMIASVLPGIAFADEQPTESPAASVAAAPDTSGLNLAAHINALGPLQFGLAPTLELGSHQVSGLARFRWMNPGLLTQALPPEGSHEEVEFSYGLALGGRYYLSKDQALSGVHFGLWLELLRTRLADTEEDREAYLSNLLVPQAEVGYRFRFGKFLLGFGGALGYAKTISSETEDLSNGENLVIHEVEEQNTIYGGVSADVGFFL